ncbi:uncharacterized protein LOC116404479 isoform X2 [Cucumis sativus]|uniref:uncharacterized protein LOC116404479 isoform X2 n=1 Tax=Cucumis sativus TaxID=3659 RepID=UPI0012F4B23E|nr:uncharacterized protein LOC116404479 isoform X2 [Cucumis sativus]
MDYIMLNAPTRVYKNMTYTSVEISSSLAEVQRQTVGEVRSHQSKFKVECRDAVDLSGWGDMEEQPCWVIMLENTSQILWTLMKNLMYALKMNLEVEKLGSSSNGVDKVHEISFKEAN